MMTIEFFFLLMVGPVAWLVVELTSRRAWRIIVGAFALSWVGYWPMAMTSKYMASEIKGITFALDRISALEAAGERLGASEALSIYKEKRDMGESAYGASRTVIDHMHSLSSQHE